MSRVLFSVWFRVLFKIRSAAFGSGFSVLLKMSRILFSVWFGIQGIIQNTSCSVWFRIQRVIKKCPGYYSASGSVFRVLFKMRPAASGSGFSVLLKNAQGIIQRLVQYSGIIQNTTCSVWFRFQRIKKCPKYYSASGSGFSVLLKIVHGIIQSLVQYSAYY